MSKIAVLIPALNAEDTIGAAVYSTLKDLPPDANVLVMNDGSHDKTAQVAHQAAQRLGREKDLTVFEHSTPQGVAASLNEMLAATDAELIGRMDADDVTLPGRFRASLNAINAGDDFVFTQVIKTRGWRARPNPPVAITPAGFPIELLLTNPVAHSAMLARRSAFDTLNGYREVPAEDYDIWMRAAYEGLRLRRLRRWGLRYRTHPGQLTATSGWFGTSWSNPQQAQAYADLSEKLTGHRLRRLVAIAHESDTQRRNAELDQFEEAVQPLVRSVKGGHGVLIRRRFNARLAWARSAPSDLATSLEQRRRAR